MLVVDGDLAEESRMRKRRKKVLLICFLLALLKGCWRGQWDGSMDQVLTIPSPSTWVQFPKSTWKAGANAPVRNPSTLQWDERRRQGNVLGMSRPVNLKYALRRKPERPYLKTVLAGGETWLPKYFLHIHTRATAHDAPAFTQYNNKDSNYLI